MILLSGLLLVTGCGSGSPGESPDGSGEPLANVTGEAPFFIDEISVRVAESFPVQLFLDVAGSAPSPCHDVAYTIGTTPEQISVAITTTSQGRTCAQVLQRREFAIVLGSADLPVTVDVNGGEFVETVTP